MKNLAQSDRNHLDSFLSRRYCISRIVKIRVLIITYENYVNKLSKSTSCSSLRAPTRNPFNIGAVMWIPGQAQDDGRWIIFLNLLTLLTKMHNERGGFYTRITIQRTAAMAV